jgi:hypothetical protein
MTSTSATSFVRSSYSDKNKGGTVTLIMKESLWINNLNLIQDVPMMNLKVHCKYNYSSCRVGGGITFVQTFKLTFSKWPCHWLQAINTHLSAPHHKDILNFGTTWRSYVPCMLYTYGKTPQNHRTAVCVSTYRVIQEESALLWEMIV